MQLDELERELTGEMIELGKQFAVVDAELAKLGENWERRMRLIYHEEMNWVRVEN